MNMKRISFLLVLLTMVLTASAQKNYRYKSYEGDPLKARIYTLDNGLQVYLSVNKDRPRIQTYIAVRTGSKNDPHETTGLAHYLEHILFKGTTSFGTQNYAAEKPLLDQIRNLYEVYRQTTDPAKRKAIYHQIDSISYEASKYSIANEYDKLMAAIGSDGTNAHTSTDETVYKEDIPSNAIESWAIVQADRFKDMVIRGFHTELEAVYEEYNRSLTSDFRKVFEQANKMLFPHHPYGMQTTIGTQEHLKNPSIVNIENYFKKYYVPNNVAISMSGDLDFDKTIAIIDKYFGDWKPSGPIAELQYQEEGPMTKIEKAEVWGLQQEMVILAWRMPGNKSQESDYYEIMQSVLQNGKSGLFDVDLSQKQKVLEAMAFNDGMTDYSEFMLVGVPKEGQTLDEVKDLMLEEVEKLREGDFDESMLQAIINNRKLQEMRSLESNQSRATEMYSYFIAGRDWADKVTLMDRLSKFGKQDVVDMAKKYLKTDAYVLIYKRQGPDPNEKKIDKPAISPIEMNRDKSSQFVENIKARQLEPIHPVFVDFNKDLSKMTMKNGSELLYKKNEQNGIFNLTIVVQNGQKQDKFLEFATIYFNHLGTKKQSLQDIQAELYKLACNASISVGTSDTYIRVSGLAENQEAAIALLENWIKNVKADEDVYEQCVADELTARTMMKSDQSSCESRLLAYCMYGPKNSYTDIPSEAELRAMQPEVLLKKLQNLKNLPQTVMYYGPSSMEEVNKMISKYHKVKKSAQKDVKLQLTDDDYYVQQTTPQTEVYLAPYQSKAVKLTMYSDNGEKYNKELIPYINIFNEYFGGSMNAIVFQELREARGLAYSAGASYSIAGLPTQHNTFRAVIGSQNDKMADCIDVFNDIIENMPVSEKSFNLAKDAVVKRYETNRTIGASVLNAYFGARRRGLDHDINAELYNKVKTLTMDDIVNFSKKNVAGRKYKFVVLGDEKELDMKKLESVGKIHKLTLEDIFGY